MIAAKYIVTAPRTPGAQPSEIDHASALRAARTSARVFSRGRPDLTGQDVRIERADGSLVEYAGPSR